MDREVRLIRSPISVVGMVFTTMSAVLFVVVFLAEIFGFHSNPYIGIVFFVVLPAVFLLGLALIPIGAWLERRRRRAGKAPSELNWPRIDLNDAGTRRTTVAIFALTLANITIVSVAAYRGVEYLDSVPFCGQLCHTVMEPEFVAHQEGPHSRVACVECHVGSGASSFANSKVAGTRQLFELTTNSFPRPIQVPVRSMRPARDTCEQCHWPEKFHGDVIRKVAEYADDEKGTESVTTLTVHVGGGSASMGIATGIHWHMNVANEVEYIATDDKRQEIPWVRLKDSSGNVREYTVPGTTPEQLQKGERHRMDCMDCHNRPSHAVAATAERAVDRAIAQGELLRSLPFVRREAVKAVKASYPTRVAASDGIARSLEDFYRAQLGAAYGSRQADVDKAVQAAQRVFSRNVFPAMKVQFGTYANNIGHIDFPGCFRCHDDNHQTQDGKKIGQDCDTCHSIE